LRGTIALIPRPKAVVVSPLSPIPPIHGNCRRLASLLTWLRTKGFATTLVIQPIQEFDPSHLPQVRQLVDDVVLMRLPSPSKGQRLRRKSTGVLARVPVLWRLNRFIDPPTRTRVVIHADRMCWRATNQTVRRLVRRDDVALIISSYAWFSCCFRRIPKRTLKIIDTVEVFQRDRRARESIVPKAMVIDERSEKNALRRADILVAIQEYDAAALRELAPATRVVTARHVPFQTWRDRVSLPRPDSALFVGSDNPYNREGLSRFLRDAWPAVRAACPNAVLDVVGSLSEEVLGRTEGVVCHGRVTDDQLRGFYSTTAVVVVPLVAGTGLKIKCVEALSAGCPVVTTPSGAEGLDDGAGWAFLTAPDWGTFAAHVVTLLGDDATRAQLERGARAFAAVAFDPAHAFAELETALREAGCAIADH
jgi:glycosyltransferase involved in cell wall biosynthesis